MAGAAKALLPADFVDGRVDGGVLELDHFVAFAAIQVFVLRVAVIVFVERARADLEAAQQGAGQEQAATKAAE